MQRPRYVLITPVRNEEEHLRETIDSVASQTIIPTRWVIVNDGSTDQTGRIADEAARSLPWLTVVHRKDRGFRRSGAGVVEAFYDGYDLAVAQPWDFLGKLDGDLSFNPAYFEECFKIFAVEPKLGIGGGTIVIGEKSDLHVESKGDPSFHVRGATKIYRRECWEAIDGLLRETGWDTLDEVKANMLGWSTRTFHELPVAHHRETGGADGTWKNWFKNGRANYIVGYHPVFMFLKCLKRLHKKPMVTASVALGAGFMSGYFKGIPQVQDRKLIQYLRRQQINRLLLRKSIWSN